MTSLRDAHVIITGGSEGIGRATAAAAIARGARVSLIARRTDALRAAATELGPPISAEVARSEGVLRVLSVLITGRARKPADKKSYRR